jgi:hypothetical protein
VRGAEKHEKERQEQAVASEKLCLVKGLAWIWEHRHEDGGDGTSQLVFSRHGHFCVLLCLIRVFVSSQAFERF